MAAKLKKGDKVVVLAGKDKGGSVDIVQYAPADVLAREQQKKADAESKIKLLEEALAGV